MLKTDFRLRQATIADITILREFEQGVVEAERPFSANLRDGKAEYYNLEKLIKDRDSCLMVAEINDKLAACGYARIERNKTYLRPSRFGYFGFMYVAPDHRGRGLITKIMESLTAWCDEQGVSAYKLDVYAANESAVKAYEKFGFKVNMLEMWKS